MSKLADIDWQHTRDEHGDSAMLAVARAQGFDGKPDVISDADLDARIAGGDRELFRGVKDTNGGDGSSARYASQFSHGEYFPGAGFWGSGIYTAHADDKRMTELQDEFRDEPRNPDGSIKDPLARKMQDRDQGKVRNAAYQSAAGYAGAHGTVMRMALDKNARVADGEQLRAEWKATMAALGREQPPDVNKMILYTDMGRYAAARGYDAVDLSSLTPGEMLVLNRGALHVSARTSDGKGPTWQSG